jgi:hypothetical protein
VERGDNDGEDGGAQDALEQVEHERDALAARVAALENRQTHRRRVRRAAVVVLLVLGTASFTTSTVGWWARRNVADTDVWMERVGPLPADPAVRAALSRWLGDQVVDLIDPQKLFAEVLPERGQILAGPLGNAVEGFVRERVAHFVASERFHRLWLAANERAHTAVIRLLRGESDAVDARGDRVVIDLVPIVDAALAEVGSASPDLLGRQVNLPDISVNDLPKDAIPRLERALGVDLPDNLGQIVIYDRGRLNALQDGLEQARRWLIVLTVVTVVCFAAALGLSDRRRRTLLQIVAGLAIGLALIRRLGIRGQRELLGAIPDEVNRNAAHSISDRFLEPLLASTKTILVVLALLALVVLVTGPYPWAVRLRQTTVRTAQSLGRRAGEAGTSVRGGAAGEWVQAHVPELRIGGVVLLVLILLVADLSFVGLLLLAGLAGLGALALSRVEATRAPEGVLDDAGRPG